MKDNNQLLYGLHPIREALVAGKVLDKLFVLKDMKTDQAKELISLAKEAGVSIIKSPKEKLDRLCKNNHQGFVAFTSPIEFGNLDVLVQQIFEKSEAPFFIVLDKVNDVRNFGSIARSALCAGAHAIIIPHKGASSISEDAIKTSAGALHYMPVCKVSSLGDAIKTLFFSGVATVACHEKSEKSIHETDFVRPINILLGNEGEGIEPHLVRMARETALIPMHGEVSSLNVAVASGICLFEVSRQRAAAGLD